MWKVFEFLVELPSKVKTWLYGLGGLLALLSFAKVYLWKRDRDSIVKHENEKALKNIKVKRDAKKVGFEEKRDAAGLSDGDLSDRLRGRTDDWGRL